MYRQFFIIAKSMFDRPIYLFKVSEYPFKQNRGMLKNMTVLLYTYSFNVSLNVIRITFFNVCNLPFLSSPNIGKIGSKLGQKLTTFPTLWAPAPTELQFSIIICHWYVANQETNKTVPTIFFLLNIFWVISFWLFLWKLRFQTRRIIAIKNEQLTIRQNAGMVSCSSLLEMCVQSLKLIVWAVFVLELLKCSPHRNQSLVKFL